MTFERMDQSRGRSVWRQGVSGALTIVLLVSAHVASAQAISAAGLVMTPATFSVLNPSIFGDNSAVVLGAGYGQRPLAKTYLFSGSLSHVRFQFGRTIWPYPTYGAKSLMTSLDYAHGMYSPAISPSVNVVSGVQGSVGYGVFNYRDGTGTEGVVAGLLVASGVRFSGPGFRVTPYLAPGFFYARQAFVGYECGQGFDCSGQTDGGFQFSFGGGLRLDLLERLSLEAGVRKTQTSNAKSRRSFGVAYRFGNLDRHGLRDAGTFTFQMDNDFFASYRGLLDEDYTQGFHFTFNRRQSPRAMSRLLDRFEKCQAEEGCATRTMVLAGQEIYTPRYYPSTASDDRPFAGWLYGGLQSSAVTERDLTSLSIKAGVTGPPSLAQQLQVTFHELVPAYKVPDGWNDQLKLEPGLIVTASRKNFTELRAGAASIGMITYGSASLGNILTDAEAGITLRAGLNGEHPWNFDRARRLGGYASFGVREDIVLHSCFWMGTLSVRDRASNGFHSSGRRSSVPVFQWGRYCLTAD